MKRIGLVVLVIAAAAGAAGAWWQLRQRPRPPSSAAAADNGRPVRSGWLEDLNSRNPREVEAATREVTRLGSAALPEIQATIHDAQARPEQLQAALKACRILGRTAEPLIGDVSELLLEPGLTEEAALALSHMGPDAFPALREAASEPDAAVRREALRSIGKMRERAPLAAEVVVPLLVRYMKDEDESVRAVAATYLGIVHERPAESVPALMAGLADPSAEVRRTSAAALGSFAPDAARPALPALRKAARDPEREVAREAGQALVLLQQK